MERSQSLGLVGFSLLLVGVTIGWAATTRAADILVSSCDTDSILRFDEDGDYLGVFVAAGSNGLDCPRHLEWGPDGLLYVASRYSDAVLIFDGVTGAPAGTLVPPGANGLNDPHGLEYDAERGLMYVSSTLSHEVHQYALDGTYFGVVAATNYPSGLLMRNFELFTSSVSFDQVRRFDVDFAADLGVFGASNFASSGLNGPEGIIFDRDGNLKVAATALAHVFTFDGTSGAFLDYEIPVNSPTQLVWGPGGSLLAASYFGDAVVAKPVDSDDWQTLVTRQSGGLQRASGLAVRPTAPHFLSTSDGIYEVNVLSGLSTRITSKCDLNPGPCFASPQGLVMDAAGDLILVNSAGPKIQKVVVSSGAVTEIASGSPMVNPRGVTIDGNGNYLVADQTGLVIRIHRLTGTQTVVSSGGLLVDPIPFLQGITLDANGDIIVTGASAARALIRVNPSNGAQSVVPIDFTPSGGTFRDVTTDFDGNLLAVTPSNWIYRVDAATGAMMDRKQIRDPLGETQITSLALNDAGEIVVADQFGGAHIRRVDPGFAQSNRATPWGAWATTNGIAVIPVPEPDIATGIVAGSLTVMAMVRRRRASSTYVVRPTNNAPA